MAWLGWNMKLYLHEKIDNERVRRPRKVKSRVGSIHILILLLLSIVCYIVIYYYQVCELSSHITQNRAEHIELMLNTSLITSLRKENGMVRCRGFV